MALWVALALVTTGEVEDLDQMVGSGQHHLEAFEGIVVRAVVGQHVPQPKGPACDGLDLGDQSESGR